jgi:aryl-alcohol dehydrogenase-like predicted oxidoreductase
LATSDLTVGSKWGYTYTANWRVDATTHEVKDHTLPVLTRQLAESRSLLGAHLDLYQIHSAMLESGVLDDAGVIDALASARATGLRIGFSVSGPRQGDTIWRALDVRRDGERVFDAVQATWNLFERAAEPALRAAHDLGVGVIVKEAVANGRLTSRGLGSVAPDAAEALVTEANRLGVTPDVLALGAVLAQPFADVVLSGATTVDQLESNVAAYRLAIPADALARLAALTMDTDRYWRERGALRWN